jgi:hypothetical protein
MNDSSPHRTTAQMETSMRDLGGKILPGWPQARIKKNLNLAQEYNVHGPPAW